MRYRATVRVTMEIEFEDDETSDLTDQAHDEARGMFPDSADIEVIGEPEEGGI